MPKLPVLFSMNRGRGIEREYATTTCPISMNRGKDIEGG